MELSNKNANILLVELNQDIEEYAEAAVKNIIESKDYDSLIYPPNNGLTDLEKAELDKLDNNEHLKNALRKIIADNSAGVIFNLLNLVDGTTDPKNDNNEWSGVQLIDIETDDDTEAYSSMLHDGLFDAYWEWKKIRGDKNWKLDTLDD